MVQPLGMLGQLEDLATINPFALENAAGIVQSMGQHMHLSVSPGQQFTIEPDHAIAIMKREH